MTGRASWEVSQAGRRGHRAGRGASRALADPFCLCDPLQPSGAPGDLSCPTRPPAGGGCSRAVPPRGGEGSGLSAHPPTGPEDGMSHCGRGAGGKSLSAGTCALGSSSQSWRKGQTQGRPGTSSASEELRGTVSHRPREPGGSSRRPRGSSRKDPLHWPREPPFLPSSGAGPARLLRKLAEGGTGCHRVAPEVSRGGPEGLGPSKHRHDLWTPMPLAVRRVQRPLALPQRPLTQPPREHPLDTDFPGEF